MRIETPAERLLDWMFKWFIGWPARSTRRCALPVQIFGWVVQGIWLLPAMLLAIGPMLVMCAVVLAQEEDRP